MLREAYSRERETTVRRHGSAAAGTKISRVADLSVSEADFTRP
jgi:hypothetical protein